ncbi:MAG: helix-turn-helix domain-containing protein [Planctomycetaceae bacterium]|nr:MAG: helix-turn-helix domain-containing protein [Planctomycetaceae bacterium]
MLRSGGLAQRVARRARVLLAMTRPQTVVQQLAERVELTPQSIWEVCHRYKERGLAALWDAPRSGRPRQFSPLGPSTGRAIGLL